MKKCKEEHQMGINKEKMHGSHGPSSFYKLNSELAFEIMKLKKGDVLADLGCGAGDYTLHAANLVGTLGKVFAVDVWAEMFERINNEARSQKFDNIVTIESNICQAINLENSCADHCLLATVMHAQKVSGECKNLFPEIVRILKPGGQLTIIECKKEEMPFGPPLNMRISPDELEESLKQYGFQKQEYADLGYYYAILFKMQ